MRTIFNEIGDKIRLWLIEQNKSEVFFADKMCVSVDVMNKIINGKKALNVAEITKISCIMDISVDSLIKSSNNLIEEPIMRIIKLTENENTKDKLLFLNHVMDEIIELEVLLS
jgi:transcriptional regulator with XRE-family HTH domain